jgi:uncharacterized protein DUF4272
VKLNILFLFAAVSLAAHAENDMSTQARKEHSESYLKKLGIPVNVHLPRIESETETKLRSPQDVAKRCLVLCAVCGVGHDVDRAATISWLRREGLWEFVSPTEQKFLESATPTKQQKIDATWRSESIWVLLWSLGYVKTVDLPTKSCDVDFILKSVPNLGDPTEKFVHDAHLISFATILDQADLIYRIHWAVRDAQLNGRKAPGGFDSGIVVERHYTLNWLIFYADDWDEITTDT